MGVDYDAVGGMGILITEGMLAVSWGSFKSNDNEDDSEDVSVCDKLDTIGITYVTAGDGCYGGEDRYYWVVDGSTLPEIIEEAPTFIARLGSKGVYITLDDIKVIEDLSIW